MHLADIRRGASLSDVLIEVNVAHTKSRLKARFFVEMVRVDSGTGRVASKWGFGVSMSEVKAFESQLLRLVKKHNNIKRSRGTSTATLLLRSKKTTPSTAQEQLLQCSSSHDCAMCRELRLEMKRWRTFSSLEAVGKRHMDTKCARVASFLYKLLRVVHTRATWLHDCALLREILRRTEALCRIEYPNDRDALCVIASLQRLSLLDGVDVHGIDNSSSSNDDVGVDDKDDECAICLSSLREPEHSTARGDANASRNSSSSAPARGGVELMCGHRFHDTCICLWFHTRLNCPICRTHAVDAALAASGATTTTTPTVATAEGVR